MIRTSFISQVLMVIIVGTWMGGCGGGATTETGEALTVEAAYKAAETGDLETVIVAIENGTLAVNDPDPAGRTLLHHAAANNQFKVVNELIEYYQADATLADSQGRTALSYARDTGNSTLVSILSQASGGV